MSIVVNVNDYKYFKTIENTKTIFLEYSLKEIHNCSTIAVVIDQKSLKGTIDKKNSFLHHILDDKKGVFEIVFE